MFSKAILALPLLGLVQARPFLHDNAYEAYVKHGVRDDSTCAVVTVTVDETVTITATANNAAATTAAATTTAASAAASSTDSASQIGDFGKCTVPQIEFGVGFDNRKETSFQPVDRTSYTHGSAQNIDIITQFMCDQLVNFCGANDLAKQTCATAKAAADTVTAKTGGQADAFNAVFGIVTDFASIAPVSDQGVTQQISASTSATAVATTNVAIATSVATDTCAAQTVTVTVDATDSVTTTATATATASATSNVEVASTTDASSAAAAASSTASASSIGDFGSCTVPQIEFGVGFDNRKETSFQPVDQTSYNHGSAQNIDIITQFICDTLTNTCGADALAKQTCATAKAAADTVTAKTGGQADAFNAVFGIVTDFASIAPVSDTGVTESIDATTAAATATSSASAAATVAATSTADAAATTTDAASTDAATTSTSAAATASASASSSSSSSIGDFGKCSVPEIIFAVGLDGRTETAFEPKDLTSYNHGSADAIGVIADFICGQLSSACGADATAQATCQTATTAANAATAKTGAQADAFNAAFGIVTDFASVPVVSDQGVTQSAAARRALETSGLF